MLKKLCMGLLGCSLLLCASTVDALAVPIQENSASGAAAPGGVVQGIPVGGVTPAAAGKTEAERPAGENHAETASVPSSGAQEVKSQEPPKPQEPSKPAAPVAPKEKKIVINIASRSLALYQGDEKIRLYPLGLGKPYTPTPTGYYKINSKDVNPTWVDPSDLSNVIPSGENNPLGYRWMLLYGHYGIHGTNRPDSIGHYVSNGCIRMKEADVEALFDLVEVGTPVEITYNRIVVEKAPDDTIVYYIYPDGYDRQPLNVDAVNKWLSGYGISAFESNEAIEAKIAASDGEPTFIGKVYNAFVNGTRLPGKAVMVGNVTYLPAVDIAQAVKVNLGWKPETETLVTPYGTAKGYNKKDVLYCNASDTGTLFHLRGSLDAAKSYVLKTEIPAPTESAPNTASSPSTATPRDTRSSAASVKSDREGIPPKATPVSGEAGSPATIAKSERQEDAIMRQEQDKPVLVYDR